MSNFFYTRYFKENFDGDVGDHAAADLRVALVMTNTTADTEEDIATMDGFSTLDEFDGANYVRKALGSLAVSEDQANDRAELDAADVTWTALGAGTRPIAGGIVHKHVTDDTDSVPYAWLDEASGATTFPFAANGGDITFQWNAEGIFQLANAA